MKGIKSIGIYHDRAAVVCRKSRKMLLTSSKEQLREIFVPKAIAKYWHTQDTFDLFFGVRITLLMFMEVLDEALEVEESIKQASLIRPNLQRNFS